MSVKYRLGKSSWRNISEGAEKEWLITNGIGGFGCGTVIGNIGRAQHSYLVAALNPPVDRISILNCTRDGIEVDGKWIDFECQTYKNKNFNGHNYLESFEYDIIPKFVYQFDDIRLEKIVCLEHGKNTVVVKYVVNNGSKSCKLKIKPVFGCYENGEKNIDTKSISLNNDINDNNVVITNDNDKRYVVKFYTSDGLICERKNNQCYEINKTLITDMKNGYDFPNVDFCPFDIIINLEKYEKREFYLKCTIENLDDKDANSIIDECINRKNQLLKKLSFRDEYIEKLTISADNFIVDRKSTGLKTILAGYPWFLDWGRDTMIAFQGLTLCTGRFDDAKAILESFAMYEKNGLIPNHFPSSDADEPMYNTVDASLWYFYSVDKYLSYTGMDENYEFIRNKIYPVLKKIIYAYKNGTDFSIKMDDDCLIHAGSGLDQVTWMDVRVDEWVVTPRHGKPVEINALWYNALMVMTNLSKRYGDNPDEYEKLAENVKKSFNAKFWNEEKKCLYDVVDDFDNKIRPNQIWAISLPYTMLNQEKEKMIVNNVYTYLYTAYGLRTLSYTDKEFKPQYKGELSERDAAYHMGTVWPFLLGGFITAYCKVNNYSKSSVERARQMCITCFDHLNDGCINGISEVFDGLFPCTGNGCFNQAWSVGELLRAYTEDIINHSIK